MCLVVKSLGCMKQVAGGWERQLDRGAVRGVAGARQPAKAAARSTLRARNTAAHSAAQPVTILCITQSSLTIRNKHHIGLQPLRLDDG